MELFVILLELLSGGTPKTAVSEYWDGGVTWFSSKDVTSSNGTFISILKRQLPKKGLIQSSAKSLQVYD